MHPSIDGCAVSPPVKSSAVDLGSTAAVSAASKPQIPDLHYRSVNPFSLFPFLHHSFPLVIFPLSSPAYTRRSYTSTEGLEEVNALLASEHLGLSGGMVIQPQLGPIYRGEVFRVFFSVSQTSKQPIVGCSMKVEMRNEIEISTPPPGTIAVPLSGSVSASAGGTGVGAGGNTTVTKLLFDSAAETGSKTFEFQPAESKDLVVTHHLVDVGEHWSVPPRARETHSRQRRQRCSLFPSIVIVCGRCSPAIQTQFSVWLGVRLRVYACACVCARASACVRERSSRALRSLVLTLTFLDGAVVRTLSKTFKLDVLEPFAVSTAVHAQNHLVRDVARARGCVRVGACVCVCVWWVGGWVLQNMRPGASCPSSTAACVHFCLNA